MLKDNKIKKILAFSIISSGVLFCGTNAHAVKIPPNSGQVTPSRYLRGPMRRPVHSPATLLRDIKNGDAGDLGKYIVVSKSGLLLDLHERYPDIKNYSALTLDFIKYLHQDFTD